MTSGGDARQWQETAQHLVQAHGALPGALTSYAPTLEQLRFAHADTHEALAGDGAAAPDGHTHTGPVDPGYPYARDSSFRPFPPGPTASCRSSGPYFSWETGLPQTMWETGVPPAYQEAFEASLSELHPDWREPEASQMTQAAGAPAGRQRAPDHTAPARSGPDPAAEPEAGQ